MTVQTPWEAMAVEMSAKKKEKKTCQKKEKQCVAATLAGICYESRLKFVPGAIV